MKSLTDKVAVITGAASGIGRATAFALAGRGTRVETGGQAVGVGCDVLDDNAFDDLKSSALDHFGAVDVVMNNVGGLTSGLPDHLPVSEWQRVIDLNLMSVVRSNSVFLPLLIGQGHGHIVNTASFAGLFSYSYDRLPYAAAKAAVVQLSEGLRLYLTPVWVSA